jgi:hypothetical protein
MEGKITLALDRADAELLIKSLQCRKERLCDIRQELCDQGPADEFEREELVYFEQQEAAVQRIIAELRATLEMAPTG